MRRAILIAMLLTLVVSGAALATPPTTVLWSDNFNSYTAGLFRTNATGWSCGGGFNYTLVDAGGGNMVAQTAADTSSDSAWNLHGVNTDAYSTLVLHFKAKSSATATDTRTRESVYIFGNAGSGTRVAGYQYNATNYKYKLVSPDTNGPVTAYNNGAWHDFDVIYNAVSGSTVWKVDGTVLTTVVSNTKEHSQFIGFYSQTWSPTSSPTWQYDDFAFGTNDVVPEPSSLLALSAFGAGILGFIKRRRA